jgi:pimeloyl-ACP methyl ester carboxylesterase
LGREAWLAEVRRVVALPERIGPAKMTEVGRVERDGYAIGKLTFETEAGITAPGLLFARAAAAPDAPLVIYLNGDGLAADAGAGGPIEALMKTGVRVLALDPRGVGETAPGKPATGPLGYLSADYNEAFVGIHIGRPLLGQRAFDVLRVLAAMPDEKDVRIVGVGSAGPVALHAASFDGRLSRVTLRRSLASWASVARSPVSRNQLTNVVPGALRVYDLPDLIESIAPRAVGVESAVDGNNSVVSDAVR